ncbi:MULTISPECIES: hypothetical protein [unclassified Pseudomonas]|uniref:hypothetical protein n=1 Tax=unclassified Pseudomonas TaxID=196821 RepID=UPI0030D8BCEE
MTFSIKPPSTTAFTALPEQLEADSRSTQANHRQTRSAETQANAADARSFASVTDRQLIGLVRDHLREFPAGATDSYVNFNELREAAGLIATDRTSSPEAHHAAKAFLSRPKLLRKLDIGISPGKKDGRFDMDNLNYLYKFPHREWKVPRRNH